MSWMVAAVMLATLVNFAYSDAGHFFAETPKHLPRIGRRGDLPPLINLLSDEDSEASSAGVPISSMTEALAKVDGDGDGCVNLTELLRIPMIRIAILLQNPALIAPHVDVATNESEDRYSSERRPEPRRIRYLKK